MSRPDPTTGRVISDDVVVGTIRSTGSQYNLSPQDLRELSNAGVSDKVVQEMLNTRHREPRQVRVVRPQPPVVYVERPVVDPFYYGPPPMFVRPYGQPIQPGTWFQLHPRWALKDDAGRVSLFSAHSENFGDEFARDIHCRARRRGRLAADAVGSVGRWRFHDHAPNQGCRGTFRGGCFPLWLRATPKIITMLREPLARTLSHINHVQRHDLHPDYEIARGLSVEAFCAHHDLGRTIDNLQSPLSGFISDFAGAAAGDDAAGQPSLSPGCGIRKRADRDGLGIRLARRGESRT